MTREIKLLALFGKSGAGKDTIQSVLLNNTTEVFHPIVSCTTRPIREGERPDVDYHYITKEEFLERMLAEEFIEALEFNGWFYGALSTELNPNRINIGIFTPEGIHALFDTASCYGLDIMPVYVECDDKERVLRALNREEKPNVAEICRRFATDEADFQTIDFAYDCLCNDRGHMFSAEDVPMFLKHVEDFFV